jgi:hypothetical protein
MEWRPAFWPARSSSDAGGDRVNRKEFAEFAEELYDLLPVAPRCMHLNSVKFAEHDGRRCLACFECGRLFGWLDDADRFVAFNPETAESVTKQSPTKGDNHG